MERYIVPRAPARIEWTAVPALRIERYQIRPPLPVEAAAQLCWSEDVIHVWMTAKEPAILARFTGDDDMVCRDSCLETFLCPDAGDGRYFNFEFNPNGASYFGFGYGRNDRIRLHPARIRELLSIRTHHDGNSWGVRFEIPAMTIRLFMPEFALRPGHRMRANFYKCGDDLVPNHELMWSAILNEDSDFHQSRFFGELVLG